MSKVAKKTRCMKRQKANYNFLFRNRILFYRDIELNKKETILECKSTVSEI